MSEELSREISKLSVRLKDFLNKETIFAKELEMCLIKFRECNNHLKELNTDSSPKMIEKLVNLRLEALESLSNTLKKGSEAEHEKSHLLSSYGTLILALERGCKYTRKNM